MTVKRRAVALALKFPRQGVRLTTKVPARRGERDLESELRVRRADWQYLVKSNPDHSRKQLRALAPAQFAWLYRNDREWLAENQPRRITNRGRQGCRVDWQDRDQRLSLDAKATIQRLLKDDFTGRVSAREVARQLSCAATIEKNAKLIPATWRVLDTLTEDRIGYAVRRIHRYGEAQRRLRPELRKSKVVRQALQSVGA